ncbi:MAG: L-aspartate oxidase [Thermaceae bacterium]
MRVDLLVLGAGIAGVYAALAAEKRGARVLLVSKDPVPAGSTAWAQGGVAFPLDEKDLEDHLRDTLTAGRGLVDEGVARSILEEAPVVLEELRALGVRFEDPPAREGGHSRPRVFHLGGDRTGLLLLKALLAHLQSPVLEGHMVLSLLKGERVGGAVLWGPEGFLEVEAGAVLLATGGLGRLFPVTTNPPGATGDGLVLAWRVGAVLRDMELVQFHPTALPDGSLLTEAARGAGAVLLNALGERFMARYDPLGELAPRDVVARAIHQERVNTGRVYLDLRGIPDLEHRFPTVVASARALGLDPLKEALPVAPAAHYLVGGVRTDLFGFTGVPGLYAAGEVASTGFHGANRLASNSLLEGLVMGKRAALRALEDLAWGKGEAPPLYAMGPAELGGLRFWTGLEAGVVRRREGLLAALSFAKGLPLEEIPLQAVRGRAWVEAGNLALLARLLLSAALLREESRGVHFREDFPRPSPSPYHTEWQGGELRRVR